MPAVAMTDHGNMYGAIEFHQAASKANIKPIIGCEVYVAPGKRTDKKASSAREAAFHFTLLVKNEEGYKNLVKLVSSAWLEGFYYKPRIDHEILEKHSAGLIALSGCMKSEISQAILNGQTKRAKELVGFFKETFEPGDFYLEMHNHHMEQNLIINKGLRELAVEFNIKLVATNDVHFLEKSHFDAHDALICIGTGKFVNDESRMKYSPELYFKSAEEMALLFPDDPEALKTTLEIADKCEFKLDKKSKYPVYLPPKDQTEEQYIREICYEGLKKRYGIDTKLDVQLPSELRLPKNARGEQSTREELMKRLEYEIEIMGKMQYLSYFLIVWDFISWAKSNGIPVGPGRGSAAGSMVAYVMEITDCDPIRFELLFERFLNPERVSPPDIDVDFCYNGRARVIEYVRQKYGTRNVSNIITFGTMGAKSVVRDVSRVLGLPYSDGDRIAKMIPNELGITLEGFEKDGKFVGGAIDKNPDLKKAVQENPETKQVWELSTLLEGLSRNAGVHAAGVVIGDRPLDEYVPLAKDASGEAVVTQYSMAPLSDLGMLKMDFLGLKTLTVIHDALEIIKETTGNSINILEVPLDDPKTFVMLAKGHTAGVFQMESAGFVKLCQQFDVKTVDDIIAMLALYRPGPMDLIPQYVKYKKGVEPVQYAHPLLEQVCSDTCGIMIYQEQVMKAASVLAGYTMGGADLLRRAMGKKDEKKMAEEREKFVKGCFATNQIAHKVASDLFDVIEKFAGYGFNKSHSAAYGLVTYQTAWLKANYTVEFMAATLSNEINNTEKISFYVNECKKLGLEILPPDVNTSVVKFSVENGKIRYGMAGIKNVGEGAVEAIIQGRAEKGSYSTLQEFCERVDMTRISKKVPESLVKAGAFDSIRGAESRKALFLTIDSCLARATSVQRDKAAGQDSLFGLMDEPQPAKKYSAQDNAKGMVEEFPIREVLRFEKELLGFYITGHPLDEYTHIINGLENESILDLVEKKNGDKVRIVGIINQAEKRFAKASNHPFLSFTIEDMAGSMELMLFTENFEKFSQYCVVDAVLVITGTVEVRDEEPPRLRIIEVIPIDHVLDRFTKEVIIKASYDNLEAVLPKLRDWCLKTPGSGSLKIELSMPDGLIVILDTHERFKVNLGSDARKALEDIFGPEQLLFKSEIPVNTPKSKWSKKPRTSSAMSEYEE